MNVTEAKEAARPATEGSQTVTNEPEADIAPPTLRLRLIKKGSEKKKVQWTNETVDNEHLGKKKSKCCCVYVKKKNFDVSDSEESDDGDCQHCVGHTPTDPKN